MTNEKVVVTKEVAEAIKELKAKYGVYGTLHHVHGAITREPEMTVKRWVEESSGISYDTLAEILINGYEVEKSPEDKVREYYEKCRLNYIEADDKRLFSQAEYLNGQSTGISLTLEILGIKIEGVNA